MCVCVFSLHIKFRTKNVRKWHKTYSVYLPKLKLIPYHIFPSECGCTFGVVHLVLYIWCCIFGVVHLVLYIWCCTFGVVHLVLYIWCCTFGVSCQCCDLYPFR